MKNWLLALNHSLLFLCISMYLGTGWSLVLFSFSVAPQLTVDNYYLQFVPQVTAATNFFTWMTILMMVLCVIMAWAEWRTANLWVPVAVFLSVCAATALTVWVIIPLNNEMAGHIQDPNHLKEVLDEWMMLNRIRVGLWTIQWLALMIYFARQYLAAPVKPAGTTITMSYKEKSCPQ